MAEKDMKENLKPEDTVEEITIEDGDLEEDTVSETGTQEDKDETPEDSGENEKAPDGDDKGKGQKKKSFFKKDKKDKKDEKIAELTDRVMRQMAEFDNYRKRTEKEKEQMYAIGAGDVIEKLLPVIDNFERGLAAMSDEEKESSFAQGITMIYKQLMTVLEGLGVQPIEALGKEFDPNFHNAVMQQPSDEYESGVVMQELQKGYIYREKVIRHSMVMVAE